MTQQTLTITGPVLGRYKDILTADALSFLASLESQFGERRVSLLQARAERQARFHKGELPNFLPETKDIRNGDWKILGTPDDLLDRRVEITGPVDRKMMINALNCGAKTFMADYEDASSPTWQNMLDGQVNMYDYARSELSYIDPNNGKSYQLNEDTATLLVRPRGWHMVEAHATLGDQPMSASLFDFGLYIFHNAKKLIELGTGPYFYLPKMESHHEAELWEDVFVYAEEALGIPHGTIKCTVLIETLTAAFEMDEILYALKGHIVGLNCGRWDYIFSYIKCLGKNPHFLLPDRGKIVMSEAFLNAYSLRLIQTCHKRGAHAMGGMAAQIPVKNDDAANKIAFAKVTADKEREAKNGHDGTWVAHPAMVKTAMDAFDRLMPNANQIDNARSDVNITQADLLAPHMGDATEDGLRENIRIGVQYLEAWIGGRGAVPLYNLMEDAATAEIGRTQIWQQIKLKAKLGDGRTVTEDLVRHVYDSELENIRQQLGEERFNGGHFDQAGKIFLDLAFAEELTPFLTTPAYELIK